MTISTEKRRDPNVLDALLDLEPQIRELNHMAAIFTDWACNHTFLIATRRRSSGTAKSIDLSTPCVKCATRSAHCTRLFLPPSTPTSPARPAQIDHALHCGPAPLAVVKALPPARPRMLGWRQSSHQQEPL
jgi:hypothetical protein